MKGARPAAGPVVVDDGVANAAVNFAICAIHNTKPAIKDRY